MLTYLVLVAAAAAAVQADVTCPDDWVPSEESGTCIKYYQEILHWGESRQFCQGLGGDLVKIVNQEMNDLVAKNIGQVWYAWIGLNDINSEGVYVWLDETEEADYKNWQNGENDDDEDYDCVLMFFDGTWTDWSCSSETVGYPHFCEIPPVDVVG